MKKHMDFLRKIRDGIGEISGAVFATMYKRGNYSRIEVEKRGKIMYNQFKKRGKQCGISLEAWIYV
jgi:hypothetical protein